MDIDALIAAAREIDRKAELQEQRAGRFVELAAMARKAEPGSRELMHIQAESRELGRTVVDFGDPIEALRRALRAKPKKAEVIGEGQT
jgi:hypothetical protein